MDRRFAVCGVLFSIVISMVALSAAAQSAIFETCNRLAPAEIEKLEEARKVQKGAGFTALFFAPDGQLCFMNRQFGVVGDPIHIFLLVDRKKFTGTPEAQFAPCALEPAGVSIYASGTFPTISNEMRLRTDLPEHIFLHLLPRTCFNTSVDITIRESPNSPDLARYTLTQYERYRATLQVGTFFTSLHDNAYGLRPEAGSTNMRIFDKGPAKTGPEYYASVVVYGLPHYFAELGRNRPHYLGRDIVNDQGWRDRIGGVIGASATDPAKRFAIGLSFEAVRGINLVGAVEFAKVKRLVGFNEGDVFAGAENTIPVRDQWNRQFVGGLSLDFRYITALFSRR